MTPHHDHFQREGHQLTSTPSTSQIENAEKPNIIYRVMNSALESERRLLSCKTFNSWERVFPKISGLLPILMAVGFLLVSHALFPAVAFLVLGYVGHKFTRPCQNAVDSNPTTISTGASFDVIALLLNVGILALLVAVGSTAISSGLRGDAGAMAVCIQIPILVVLLMWLFLFLHPELLNVRVDERSSTGGDILSLIGFTYKLLLRSTSFLPACLAVAFMGGLFLSSSGWGGLGLRSNWGGPLSWTGKVAMVFPAIAYFFYIIANLSVALMESVLTVKAIPALLDHDSPDSDD
ncbi:MAG: hypothetical protein CMJ61_00920 [Planctomycetaceae bacterium]|nr:hypothetical protein [Planctomycetaceae bacterium]